MYMSLSAVSFRDLLSLRVHLSDSFLSLPYSQRSHLARIKGRLDKEVMLFSRSCLAVQITMADLQVPA